MTDYEQHYNMHGTQDLAPMQPDHQPLEVLGASNSPYVPSTDNPYLDTGYETQTALQSIERSRAKKRRSKRIKIVVACAVVGAVLALVASRVLAARNAGNVEIEPETYVVARMDYSDDVTATGALKAGSTVTVTPEVDGVIESVKVTEGQKVKEGDVLLTIKNDALDRAVRDAERDVTTAQQGVTTAQNELNSATAAKDDAWKRYREEWNRVDASHQDWKYLSDNYDELHSAWADRKARAESMAVGKPTEPVAPAEPGANASQQQWDQYNRALTTYQTKYNQYMADLEAYEAYQDALSQVGDEPRAPGEEPKYPDAPDDVSLDAAISSAQSALTSAETALAKAKEAQEDATKEAEKRTVKAPADGNVVALNAKVGASVGGGTSASGASDQSSSGPLVQISDISKMSVDAEVNEIDILGVEKGQKATVTFSAVPDVEVAALVKEVSSVASGSGESGGIVTFHVGLTIPYPDDKLRPGMTANVQIHTLDVRNALVVPVSAISEGSDGTTVEVVLDEETMQTETRKVKVGARGSMQVVIEEGVSEGDMLLLNGTMGDTETEE